LIFDIQSLPVKEAGSTWHPATAIAAVSLKTPEE
jgi:hypothetical protein